MQSARFTDHSPFASFPGSSGTEGREKQDTGWADQRAAKLERVIAPRPLKRDWQVLRFGFGFINTIMSNMRTTALDGLRGQVG